MAAICQTAISNAFSWMKAFDFKTKLVVSWGLNGKVSIGSENGLASKRWQAIIRTNDGVVYRIYALRGVIEF